MVRYRRKFMLIRAFSIVAILTAFIFMSFTGCTPDISYPVGGEYAPLEVPPDTNSANTNNDTYNPNATGGTWTLAWSDEFNNPGSYVPNSSVWNIEVRNDGCGNSELEYYTSRLSNVYVINGQLVIKAIRESYHGNNYTSGRLNTQNKFYWQYGKMVARIKLPYGRCLWPAFWMMGQTNLSWPNNGEIDIAEFRGDRYTNSSSALHGPGYSGGSCYSSNNVNLAGVLTNGFHYYEMIWTSTDITMYVDNIQFFSKTKASVIAAGRTWAFDRPMYFLMNLAIGGTSTPYTGNLSPDNTVYPAYMYIDWVRIYTN